MSKIVDAATAVASIPDGSTVGCVGVIGWVTPDALLRALGERFRKTACPKDLTFYFPVGTGDAQGIRGMDHVAQEGLMKRIVGGSYINPVDPTTGKRPELMRLIRENRIEAYSWPIGATMHWLREVARRSPGYMTRIGLGTYIDPENGGGKFTERAQDDLVRRIDFEGQPYLFYPTWKLDTVFVYASSADEEGNLSFENEALVSSNIALILAAKAHGGRVIAQVRRAVPHGTRPASEVRIPGMFVDAVVVDPSMMMTTDVKFEPAYFGGERRPLSQLPPIPMSADKVVALRAAKEVRKRELSIFGFGAAADVPLVMAEQGVFENGGLKDYWFTTEHGSYGGIVMSGWQFSANLNPDAILDGVYQFDAIDGGLCRFAALAFAQFDRGGLVNVSKFGAANPGAGGFIDIAENAERLVFTGTFTTGGLDVAFADGKLRIIKEGKVRKFVNKAEHITYSVIDGVKRGQTARVITERAVFEIAAEGLTLTEVAPGIDVRRDVLDQMEFAPWKVADDLKLMDEAFFLDIPRQARAS
ncbi:CoA-transferase [Bradyrhizobium sp. Leo121]|uniref:acyl CoA:acetate/3-ketoacid CoA transferase n=1 Tax=Bradyrhizobium sp. Leo121 TaxID=1571195 RepID=UPI0010297C8D|nr:CoA-transferase [Bradyrhizobium sp. Leo121]RZN35207.1 propionate CoA-transferase [Bradyrhizobium sp. Leo121]